MHRRSFCWALASASLTPFGAQAAASAPLETTWADFAKGFVRPDGRVSDSGNQGITHTEGLGTALLAAQACGDRQRFDKVWSFAQNLRRPDGLFSWKWVQGTGVVDKNNATDGDLYIAWALLRAGVKWADNGLLRAAQALAQSVRRELLVATPQGPMLLPGKDGFVVRNALGHEKVVVNPAYWVFPALRELQAADPTDIWAQLHRGALTTLERAQFGPKGLPPDWLVLDDPALPWQDRPARFGYEAIRVPLFMAWDRRFTHPTIRACAAHMKEPGFPAWVSLRDAEKATFAAPPGFEAVARLTRKAQFGQPFSLPKVDADYFSSSLTLLSALAAKDLGWV